MAILERDDANIVDVETIDWRLVVYPVLAAFVIIVGGIAYYYYQQNERLDLETSARTALLTAKTPGDWTKVADQYPHTNQATLALLDAGDASFQKGDYAAATSAYQRVVDGAETDPALRDSAQLGVAAAADASGKYTDAAQAYLIVARRGAKSAFAPFAYMACAGVYKELGQTESERQILVEAAGFGSDSTFTKEAQYALKQLVAAPSVSVPLPAANPPTPPVPPAAPPGK